MLNLCRALLVPAAAALLLAACGSGSGSSSGSTAPTSVAAGAPTTQAPATTPTTSSTSTAGSTEPEPTDQPVAGDALEIIINVDDPTQIGQTYPVALGQTVLLRMLSDTDQEYHVHGYDLEKQVAAGVEANFEFTADKAGDFEVESHTTNTVLATLQVA